MIFHEATDVSYTLQMNFVLRCVLKRVVKENSMIMHSLLMTKFKALIIKTI